MAAEDPNGCWCETCGALHDRPVADAIFLLHVSTEDLRAELARREAVSADGYFYGRYGDKEFESMRSEVVRDERVSRFTTWRYRPGDVKELLNVVETREPAWPERE
jgi:hypothetical protein